MYALGGLTKQKVNALVVETAFLVMGVHAKNLPQIVHTLKLA